MGGNMESNQDIRRKVEEIYKLSDIYSLNCVDAYFEYKKRYQINTQNLNECSEVFQACFEISRLHRGSRKKLPPYLFGLLKK